MNPSPDEEVRALRDWMDMHGMTPPVDHLLHTPTHQDRIATQITALPRPARSSPRRRRMSQALAAAAVVVAVVTIGQLVVTGAPVAAQDAPRMLSYPIDPSRLDEAPAAATALMAAADTAERTKPSTGGGGVQYVTSFGWLLSDSSKSPGTVDRALYPTTTQSWLMANGSLRVDQQRAAPLNLDGTIRTDAVADTLPSTDSMPAGTFDPFLTSTLPRDPATIADALIEAESMTGCESTHAQCLMIAIESLYATHVVPPDLAATLWRGLARESEVASIGTTQDRFGAAVQAIALATNPTGTVEVLLVSARTGLLVGTETVVLASEVLGITEPTVTGFVAIRDTTWVAAVGVTPDA